MVVSRQIVAAFVIADVGINLAISSTYLLCKQTSGQSSEQHKPRGHTCASAAAASPASPTATATVAQGSGKGKLIREWSGKWQCGQMVGERQVERGEGETSMDICRAHILLIVYLFFAKTTVRVYLLRQIRVNNKAERD